MQGKIEGGGGVREDRDRNEAPRRQRLLQISLILTINFEKHCCSSCRQVSTQELITYPELLRQN